MRYAEHIRHDLPIASGVIEATCKTLVTQRLKQSGMAWAHTGGQAVLTLRSLIQSNRWKAAWELLRADFRTTVTVCDAQGTLPTMARREQSHLQQPAKFLNPIDYAALPLAA